jgi:hypothetical protein
MTVVSINQLLLGREFETPGRLQSEMESVIEYREAVEANSIGRTPTPSRYFRRR